MNGSDDRLDSWKLIADYLGDKHERTARRWAAERGLPVHRVPGGRRASVYALKSEIDSWLRKNEPTPAVKPKAGGWLIRALWALAGGAVVVGVVAAARRFELRREPPRVIVKSVIQLTHDSTEKESIRFGANTLFYIEKSAVGSKLMSIPAVGGTPRQIPTPFPNPRLEDADRATGMLLIDDTALLYRARPIWMISPRGDVHRLPALFHDSAVWSPDGRQIAYNLETFLGLFTPATGQVAGLLTTPHQGVHHLVWSPDGGRLRFLATGDDLIGFTSFELPAQPGATAHSLNLGANCCQAWAWTRDGFFYLTRSGTTGGGTLWMIPNRADAAPQEVALPPGTDPLDFTVDPAHHTLFLIENAGFRGQLFGADKASGQLNPVYPGLDALDLTFSPDGQWLAYVRRIDHTLWRSRASGADAVQLTRAPAFVELPRWSPDGTKIAFSSKSPNSQQRIFIVDRDGGAVREASQGDDDQGAPTWSPDGKSVAYGNVDCEGRSTCAVHVIHLADGSIETLPGSNGLRTARWSPDGRSIAALESFDGPVRIFDIGLRRWRTLPGAHKGDCLAWSRDSKYLYVSEVHAARPRIVRVRVADGAEITAADVAALKTFDESLSGSFTLAPGGSLIFMHLHQVTEIVRASW